MKKSNNDWLIKVYFTKSNNLITSKSRMTIIGRKVLDAAIMNVRETYDEYGNPIIKASKPGGFFYVIASVAKNPFLIIALPQNLGFPSYPE